VRCYALADLAIRIARCRPSGLREMSLCDAIGSEHLIPIMNILQYNLLDVD